MFFIFSSVVTDRTQGGSSYMEGMIEIMIQRRTTKDDWRGVDECLNETGSFTII